mmetsp:Transcript_1621/g.5379  ORF Transcript_1621/g.5379 Transcript_1621/m.5379 type:complete len:218 (-) Transcript_1621:810-1463(-)
MCAAPRSFMAMRSSSSRIPIAAFVSPRRISETAIGIATSACILCAAISTFLALATRYGRLYANPATRCATPTYIATSAVSHGAFPASEPTIRTQSIDSTNSMLVMYPSTLDANSGVMPGCDPLIMATNASTAPFRLVTETRSRDSFSVSMTASDFKSSSACAMSPYSSDDSPRPPFFSMMPNASSSLAYPSDTEPPSSADLASPQLASAAARATSFL